MKFSHENLEIWQLAMKLVDLVYSLKDRFLSEDRFGLWDQLVRATEAIPRDIAEGYGKSSKKERALYMERAKSETAEVDTSFKEAVKKGRISEEEYQKIILPLIKELYFKIIAYRKWLLRFSSKLVPQSGTGDQPSQPSLSRRAGRAINQAPNQNGSERSTSGFTLIEVIMIVFLLGIVVVVGGNLFFSILKGASKTEITKEVKQNGDYALGVIARMIRNAKEIKECTTSSLKILNQDDKETTFVCLSQDEVRKIASNSAALTGKSVTLGAACPGTLSFTCGPAGEPKQVTISFTLVPKGTFERPEEWSQVSFQTTVLLRNY